MPQMSPLLWWILFMFFIYTFIMICILNYYITIYKPTYFTELKSFIKNNLIWKW
nr:ATP synthase F0 subunit 8 [Nemopterinae gen. 1 sp. 1 YZ-2023a]